MDVKVSTRDVIMKELKILTRCNSPFIVRFFGSYYSCGEVNILMELMVREIVNFGTPCGRKKQVSF